MHALSLQLSEYKDGLPCASPLHTATEPAKQLSWYINNGLVKSDR